MQSHPDDLVVVHPVCLFLLLDELIKEILLTSGRMLVGATDTSHGALNAHSYGRTEGWRSNAIGDSYRGENLVEGFDLSGKQRIHRVSDK